MTEKREAPANAMENADGGQEEAYTDDTTSLNRSAKYDISFVDRSKLYDYETRRYIPAKSASCSWRQIVKMVLERDLSHEKDGWGILPSSIKPHPHPKTGKIGTWRRSAGCTETNLLILDIENAPIGDDQASVLRWFTNLFPKTRALIYTTWNHGNPSLGEDDVPKWVEGEPRVRVIIPLLTPVDSQSAFPLLYLWVIARCDGAVDKVCKDPARLSFLMRAKNPASVIDPWFVEVQGNDLDPENLPDGKSLSALLADKLAKEAQLKSEREQRARLLREGILVHASASNIEKYVNAALKASVGEIATATAGSRHYTLYNKAFRLGTMVAAGMIEEGVVVEHLTAAAESSFPPARHTEAARTIRDGMRAAEQYPFDTSSLAQRDHSADLTGVIDFQRIMGGRQ